MSTSDALDALEPKAANEPKPKAVKAANEPKPKAAKAANEPKPKKSKKPKEPKEPGGAAKEPGGAANEPGGAANEPGGAAKEPGGAAKSIRFLGCEEEELVKKLEHLTALCRSDPDPFIWSKLARARQELLEKHPFVQTTETTYDSAYHSFKISGFTINMRSFREWLKTPEGKTYKNVRGTGVDDTVYLISEVLRTYLPRGCHVITATNKTTGNITTFMFNGIPKFSGLQPDDEDEESGARADAFFFERKTMADAKEVFVTEKSNGENAKLSARRIDGILYLIAGSKTTCSIWPADEHFSKSHPLKEGETCDSYPSTLICWLYSEWFLGLSEELKTLFIAEFEKHNYCATIMAELNQVDAQHIVPFKKTCLVFFAIPGPDGKSLYVKYVLEFFKSLGLTELDASDATVCHVNMRKVEITSETDFTDLVYAIRSGTNSEGAVLYLFDKDKNLIGLAKVKKVWYTKRRRIRELFRNQFLVPLTRGDCRGVPNLPARRTKPSEKTWQGTSLDNLVAAAMKKINGACGDLGVNFVKHVITVFEQLLGDELGDKSISKYIAGQSVIPFPDDETDSSSIETTPPTPLMTALTKLNTRFNRYFPQLMAASEEMASRS